MGDLGITFFYYNPFQNLEIPSLERESFSVKIILRFIFSASLSQRVFVFFKRSVLKNRFKQFIHLYKNKYLCVWVCMCICVFFLFLLFPLIQPSLATHSKKGSFITLYSDRSGCLAQSTYTKLYHQLVSQFSQFRYTSRVIQLGQPNRWIYCVCVFFFINTEMRRVRACNICSIYFNIYFLFKKNLIINKHEC